MLIFEEGIVEKLYVNRHDVILGDSGTSVRVFPAGTEFVILLRTDCTTVALAPLSHPEFTDYVNRHSLGVYYRRIHPTPPEPTCTCCMRDILRGAKHTCGINLYAEREVVR